MRFIHTMLAGSTGPLLNSEQRDAPTIDIFVFAGSECRVTLALSSGTEERLKISHKQAFLES